MTLDPDDLPAFGGPRLDPLHIPSPKGHALQRLTKQRSRFQDMIAAAKRRLLDLVRKVDPDLPEVYSRLMREKGHHHKQALCAVANRLVNRIFCVLKSGKPYVLRDRQGREISVAEAKILVAERYVVPESLRATRRANRAQVAA